MLSRNVLFVLLVFIVAVSSGICQPAEVTISYLSQGGNQPLGCPCVNGTPYAEGTGVCLVLDRDGNGPDAEDTRFGCWSTTAPGGFFTTDPAIVVDSIQYPYYVGINADGCCWYTRSVRFATGPQELQIVWADWTCLGQSCPAPPPPPAPTNFRASDDSLCAHVVFAWDYDGPAVGNFFLYHNPDSLMDSRLSGEVRTYSLQVAEADAREYFIRAVGSESSSGPSNVDLGSPYTLHFAADSTGDIRGAQNGGAAFTLHFAPPTSFPGQCIITDSLILLSNGERVLTLAGAQDAEAISGQLPNTALANCRVLLVASYETEGRGFESTDTTASTFSLTILGAGDHGAPLPSRSEITAAYPNPFNPETRIQFVVSAPEMVNLTIYNLSGQKVRTLLSEYSTAGNHAVTWDGKSDSGTPVGTGLYLCRMSTPQHISTERLLLLK